MADEVEIATNSNQAFEASQNALDFLIQASSVASKFDAVSKILRITGKLSSAFPLVGAVLGQVECFLPDAKHEEILRRFEELSSEINQVTDDIRELENMIKWEITEPQYADIVSRIELGMQYCIEIGKGSGNDAKRRYQDRLKEVCADQKITLAINALLEGMIGKGHFRKSILDDIYDKTGGYRPKISALAARLLQLLCCGMIVIATFETVKRNSEGAKEIAKLYDSRFQEACKKVEYVIVTCTANFKEIMLNDLNRFLDKSGSNKELLSEINDFMSDKYDWLENFCLVYNDLNGLDKHCIGGSRVESLQRNGKRGVVFYRTKGEPPRFSDRYEEACEISKNVGCANAQKGYKNIVDKLNERKIGWIGCAVIRRAHDLCYGGTFSSKNATVVGKNATAISLILLQ